MPKIIFILFLGVLTVETYSQCNTWTTMPDFPGEARSRSITFTVGGNGYLFAGSSDNGYIYDGWKYVGDSGIWRQIKPYPGGARVWANTFVIDTSAYMIGGYSGDRKKDVYRFDAPSEKWTKMADFLGGEIGAAVSFAIGGKGYIGTGASKSDSYLGRTDFYEYDPANDTWSRIANIPGSRRIYGIGFSDGTYGYAGLGYHEGVAERAFYRYDPKNDKWETMSSGPAVYYSQALFVNGKAIVPEGRLIGTKDVATYDPAKNEWSAIARIEESRNSMGAFAIGNYGYFVGGTGYNSPDYKTVYRYNGLAQDILINRISNQDPACHDELNGSISFDVRMDRSYYEYSIDSGKTFQTNSNFTGLRAGIYQLLVDDTLGCTKQAGTVELLNPKSSDSTIVREICFGDSFLFAGDYRKVQGFYSDSSVDVNLCDSIYGLDLTVLESPTASISQPKISIRDVEISIENLQENETIVWYMGDGVKRIGFEQINYTYKSNGTFQICAEVSNNCGSDSACVTVTVEDVGVQIPKSEKLTIYPNPSLGLVNITGIQNVQRLEVYSIQGALLDDIMITTQNEFQVDLSIYGCNQILLKAGSQRVLVKLF